VHFLFVCVHLYPFWAIPLAVVFIELGIYFRRRNNKINYFCFSIGLFLILTAMMWIGFRGDVHSDAWVKNFLY
jgi:hypothetical protein